MMLKPFNRPCHLIPDQHMLLLPSGISCFCSEPANAVDYLQNKRGLHLRDWYSHSLIRGHEPIPPVMLSPNLQNHGSVSDRWPYRFSSVRSPDIFRSCSEMSCSVTKNSGSRPSRVKAVLAH